MMRKVASTQNTQQEGKLPLFSQTHSDAALLYYFIRNTNQKHQL